jgi:hypothetical protein
MCQSWGGTGDSQQLGGSEGHHQTPLLRPHVPLPLVHHDDALDPNLQHLSQGLLPLLSLFCLFSHSCVYKHEPLSIQTIFEPSPPTQTCFLLTLSNTRTRTHTLKCRHTNAHSETQAHPTTDHTLCFSQNKSGNIFSGGARRSACCRVRGRLHPPCVCPSPLPRS